MTKTQDLDETVAKMHRKADEYEVRLIEAQRPGKPEHHAPNIRRGWYGQVMIQIHRWIDRHQGSGRAARRQELATEAGQHPEWRRLLERMADAIQRTDGAKRQTPEAPDHLP